MLACSGQRRCGLGLSERLASTHWANENGFTLKRDLLPKIELGTYLLNKELLSKGAEVG